ncbi:MAG TPA: gamma-glutamylcyclotransferase family protein [Candidatus Nanoarchaeia archaeon]|nr:gamma-glutamylcyclotransferase family protein [Candidatus Nanoarchaeia archaeon]
MPRVFQYGSNLDKTRLEKRVGSVKDLGRHELPGFRLTFDIFSTGNNCAAANITPDHDGRVVGRVYELTPEQLARLDRVEGVLGEVGNYKRISLAGGLETYVATESRRDVARCRAYPPSDEYLNHIIRGLGEIGAEEDYVRQVREAAGRTTCPSTVTVFAAYDNPSTYLPDAIGLNAKLRKQLGIHEDDLVEIEYEGRTQRMRVKKVHEELIRGPSKTTDPITISRAAREALGLPLKDRRDTPKYNARYVGFTIRKV